MLTLGQARDAYINSQRRMLSPGTVKLYEGALEHLVDQLGADLPVTDISRLDLTRWRDSLFDMKKWEGHPTVKTKNKAPSVYTIRRIMGDAATFFNWLVNIGLLDKSPMASIKRPDEPQKAPRAITAEDFKLILDEAGRYRGNHWPMATAYTTRNQAIVLFLASTGCRVGGLCSARLGTLQIAGDGAQVEVVEKSRGGGKTRLVYLSDTAAIALLEWLDHRPAGALDHVFVGLEGASAGKPMTSTSVRQMLTRLAARAGVEGRFNPHAFRHAAAREWLRNGANLQTVSQLLGHSEIGITAKFYAVWDKSELKEQHAAVDWTAELD